MWIISTGHMECELGFVLPQFVDSKLMMVFVTQQELILDHLFREI